MGCEGSPNWVITYLLRSEGVWIARARWPMKKNYISPQELTDVYGVANITWSSDPNYGLWIFIWARS